MDCDAAPYPETKGDGSVFFWGGNFPVKELQL